MKDYDVSIKYYNSEQRTVIQFHNDSDTEKIKKAYVRIFAKGNKLYFMPSDQANGKKITDMHQIHLKAAAWNDSLKRFWGEYENLLYDTDTGYYYIDAEKKVGCDKTYSMEKPVAEPVVKGGKIMTMDNTEIRISFEQAKNKSKQIGILAELNFCSKEKIRDILAAQGCMLRGVTIKDTPRGGDKKEAVAENITDAGKESVPKSADTKSADAKMPEAVRNAINARIASLKVQMDDLAEQLRGLAVEQKELIDYIAKGGD